MRLADAASIFRHPVLGAHDNAILGFGVGFAMPVTVVLCVASRFIVFGARHCHRGEEWQADQQPFRIHMSSGYKLCLFRW